LLNALYLCFFVLNKQPTNMKKTYQLMTAFTLAALVPLASCDKEEKGTDDPTTVDLACKITNVSSSYLYEGEGYSEESSSEMVFSYEGDLLKKVVDSYSYEYCYDDGVGGQICELSEGNEEYRFTYEGELVTKLGFYEDGILYGEGLIEYSGNIISKLVAEDGSDIDEYRFVYSNGKVSKIENWDNYSGTAGEFVLYAYTSFTWSGDNIVKEEGFDVFEEGGRKLPKTNRFFNARMSRILKLNPNSRLAETKSYSSTYTYDSKQNPLMGSAFMFIDLDASTMGKNNPLTVSEIEYYDGGTYTYNSTYSYEYNDKGFPTKVTNVDEDGDDQITFIEYNCN